MLTKKISKIFNFLTKPNSKYIKTGTKTICKNNNSSI